MPTYEYECQNCHERLEAVQSFSDAALTTCPACGGELRKVFSAVGIVFKGSGFYKNDSRSTTSKKSSATASDTASASTTSTSTESSATPATASPAPTASPSPAATSSSD